MEREPHAVSGHRRTREIVHVCNGIALGFMLGIPAAGLILGRLSWGLVVASVIGWALVMALATCIGRWIESEGGPES
jgi:uncharacterized membrane protein (UPF0136 family)